MIGGRRERAAVHASAGMRSGWNGRSRVRVRLKKAASETKDVGAGGSSSSRPEPYGIGTVLNLEDLGSRMVEVPSGLPQVRLDVGARAARRAGAGRPRGRDPFGPPVRDRRGVHGNGRNRTRSAGPTPRRAEGIEGSGRRFGWRPRKTEKKEDGDAFSWRCEDQDAIGPRVRDGVAPCRRRGRAGPRGHGPLGRRRTGRGRNKQAAAEHLLDLNHRIMDSRIHVLQARLDPTPRS